MSLYDLQTDGTGRADETTKEAVMGGKKSGARCWVGLDVGGTKILACVYDKDFNCLGRRKRKTRSEDGDTDPLARMAGVIREAMDEAQRPMSALSGVGIGMAGMLDLDKGILIDSPNLGWHRLKVADVLRKRLKAPVALANDVDAGAYGEYRFGAARKSRCTLGVFPGTGIGGACIYEGKLIRGKTGSAMEIGHLPVDPDGSFCGCGKRGCLETVASRLAIAGQAAQAALRGEAPRLLALAGADLAKIKSGVLSDSVKGGDRLVEQIVRRAARWLGYGCVGAIHLLAPDTLLLGGGLVEEFPSLYVEEVSAAVRERGLPVFTNGLRFAVAALGGDATALGAAAIAAEQS
jgi:glucokinase